MGRYVHELLWYVVCGCLRRSVFVDGYRHIGGALGSSGLVEVLGPVIECFMALYPAVR
jgi:hypothetical protein